MDGLWIAPACYLSCYANTACPLCCPPLLPLACDVIRIQGLFCARQGWGPSRGAARRAVQGASPPHATRLPAPRASAAGHSHERGSGRACPRRRRPRRRPRRRGRPSTRCSCCCPSNSTLPSMLACFGNSPNIASADCDLPDPDSPTSPTDSPRSIKMSALSTTVSSP